jgi:hypothetical protein
MLEVSQKVHRQLYTAAALGRSPGPDRKDCLRLESSDSYTHQGTAQTGKCVYISIGTHDESKRQKTLR